jgi:hypothetical protein
MKEEGKGNRNFVNAWKGRAELKDLDQEGEEGVGKTKKKVKRSRLVVVVKVW